MGILLKGRNELLLCTVLLVAQQVLLILGMRHLF